MIKAFPVELNYIRVAAFMFGMTRFAFGSSDGITLSMEAFAFVNIRRDLFVAGQAQLSLACFAKARMTFRTLDLVLGMLLDHGPRHDQRFPGCRPRAGAEQ